MKLIKLASAAAIAATGFMMVTTSAIAGHHCNSKNVKCMVNTCKDGKACEVMVTKNVCQQLGGVIKTAANSKASQGNTAQANQPAQTAQTAQAAQPASQAAIQQTAPAAPQANAATQAAAAQTSSAAPVSANQ